MVNGRFVSLCLMLLVPRPAAAQIPEKFENLQVLPRDIPRPQLVQRMREFSFALNVRCEYCHEQPDGAPSPTFASDARPAKQQARAMLRMVAEINGTLLPKLPSHAEPRVTVDCVTCHRGSALPRTLQTTLFEMTLEKGAGAAVERYRELRKTQLASGRFNFGEWEINELGRRLVEAGKPQEAIAIYEMNAEFYPASAAIDMSLGELHARSGNREKAVARFKSALEKDPQNQMAQRRLKELEQK